LDHAHVWVASRFFERDSFVDESSLSATAKTPPMVQEDAAESHRRTAILF
jgi:hypothetical protein